MVQAIFGQAISEYLRPKRVIPWILLAIICGILGALWHFIQPESSAVDQYATVASMLVFHLVALASAIFTTAIISQEVEQRTIVYLLTRPVPRWMLLLTRYVASVIVVALVGILAAYFTAIGTGRGFGGNRLLANDIEAILVGACAYGALFLFLSLAFNRAMLICLLFAFGWETSVPNMSGSMANLSILSYMQAIARHPSQGGDDNKLVSMISGTLGTNAISPDRGFAVLGILTLALLVLCAWWFTHFEYVPREDAE